MSDWKTFGLDDRTISFLAGGLDPKHVADVAADLAVRFPVLSALERYRMRARWHYQRGWRGTVREQRRIAAGRRWVVSPERAYVGDYLDPQWNTWDARFREVMLIRVNLQGEREERRFAVRKVGAGVSELWAWQRIQ